MRLVNAGTRSFEVHHEGRKIGRVWWYDGRWRGETNNGTVVPSSPDDEPTGLGREIERLHKAGR